MRGRWRSISAVVEAVSRFAEKDSSVSRMILGAPEIFVRLIAAQKVDPLRSLRPKARSMV